jgi:DHA3 family tetracycline resistance protein-like MFS transporter
LTIQEALRRLGLNLAKDLPMLPARTVYLASSFAWGMLFWMMAAMFMVYQVEIVGLDPLQLVLVGTALELSAFVCEVPTGVVADTWSRKLSVVLGYGLTGVAFLIMGAAPAFWLLVAGSVVWGLGWTLVSGAREAWLADEIGESEAASLYLRGARLLNYGAFLGIAIAVVIGSIEVHYPVLLAGVLFIAWSILLVFLMPERGFTPQPSAGLASMSGTLKQGVGVVRGSTILLMLMAVGVVIGTFSEGYDRLSAAHLLRNFAFIEQTRLVDTDNTRQLARSLSVAVCAMTLCVLVFALTGSVWLAVAMYILLQPVRSIVHPLTMAWFNRNIPSSSRATVISMHSQADALGQIAGGPAMGMVGREWGIRVALSASALLLLPAVWLYGRVRQPAGNLAEAENE